jgi:hypothetical protein
MTGTFPPFKDYGATGNAQAHGYEEEQARANRILRAKGDTSRKEGL